LKSIKAYCDSTRLKTETMVLL